MSAFSSISSYTSVPANVPCCDAWGNFTVGSAANVSLLDGYGISGVSRTGTGVFGISFSNPERFGGGAYVVLATPEFSIDSGYGPLSVGVPNGNTGAGLSAGVKITTFTYAEGFHPGGGTASINDPATGVYRINLAAFALATESDLRVPAVANYIRNSESVNQSTWNKNASGTGLPPQILSTTEISPIGTPTAAKVTVNAVNASSTSNYSLLDQSISPTGWTKDKPWTWSFWAKGIVGGEKIIARGAAGSGYQLITLTTEWKRYSFTEISANTAPNLQLGTRGTYGSDVSATFCVWGFQHEPGSILTDYVPTTSTAPVLGNQDARKRLVPGAGGFGADGNTYASTPHKNYDKRRAVAYGTIVIPPSKGNSSQVTAYIENGFNIKGVSAGVNSLFDLTFVQPMANNNYCVVLCGEYESNDYTAATTEFSLLCIRAGTGNKFKTPQSFRVESRRQNTADNSWTQQSVRYQSGLTERIHFMVFGEFTQGQSFLTNPNLASLSIPFNSLDYNVWSTAWADGAGSVTDPVTGSLQNKKAIVRMLRPYVGGSAGYFNATFQPDLGITSHTSNALPSGNVTAWANIVKPIPRGRRAVDPRFYPHILPVDTKGPYGYQRERLYQYYAIRDGYTYTSVFHPSGITNAGFTIGSAYGAASSILDPVGTTFSGATFPAERRVLGLFMDNMAADINQSFTDFLDRMSREGATLDYITCDAENEATLGGFYLGGGQYRARMGTPALCYGAELNTVTGIGSSSTSLAGITSELLFDAYGISAAGSSSKRVNVFDPEKWRWLVSDPRVNTYRISPTGITNDSSPTVAERYMQIYNRLCNEYKPNFTAGGSTATSIQGAIDQLYAAGASAGAFPSAAPAGAYWVLDRGAYRVSTGPTTIGSWLNNIAWDILTAEIVFGHYRSLAYKGGIQGYGMTYTAYAQGGVSEEDVVYRIDANANPVRRAAVGGLAAPTIYGSRIGTISGSSNHIVVYGGYYPNPATNSQRYFINGYTYAAAGWTSAADSLGGRSPVIGARRFYPRTAQRGPITEGITGTMSPSGGATAADSAPVAGRTGFTAWGVGATYNVNPGDFVWFHRSGGGYYPPLTIFGATLASPNKKCVITVHEPIPSGLVLGNTFEIEKTESNRSFMEFIVEMQATRAMLRGNPQIAVTGFAPYITSPSIYENETGYHYWTDTRYWWELVYHLLVSGTNYFHWWHPSGETDYNGLASASSGDGGTNSVALQRALDNWRDISGNGQCVPVTTSKIDYSSPVLVSGGRLKNGQNADMYIWRITVRPGRLNETVNLVQSSRSDIPKRITISGGNFGPHSFTVTSAGTKGTWLLTKSSEPPVYTIE